MKLIKITYIKYHAKNINYFEYIEKNVINNFYFTLILFLSSCKPTFEINYIWIRFIKNFHLYIEFTINKIVYCNRKNILKIHSLLNICNNLFLIYIYICILWQLLLNLLTYLFFIIIIQFFWIHRFFKRICIVHMCPFFIFPKCFANWWPKAVFLIFW